MATSYVDKQLIDLDVLHRPLYTTLGRPGSFHFLAKRVAESRHGSPFPALDDRTSSRSSLDQAYGWLTSCRSQHPSCNRLSKAGSWLIDIGSEADDLWKLRVVAEHGRDSSSALFIALSYRWGTTPSIKLLGSNIDSFRRGKPIRDLPQTFRDLVVVARHFSVRYVWIDALCIIQDSAQDWAAESAAMRHVYANSICTVAASASSSPEGGLFRLRQPKLVQPAVVNIACGDARPEDYYLWDKGCWGRNFYKSELLERGWIFQERFLSPRVLSFGHSFGHHQILWECMMGHKCEGFPDGVPSHTSDKNSYAISKLVAPRQGEPDAQDLVLSDGPFNIWAGLVDRYTQCSLTKPTDRLAAFAGIAKLFQEHVGDQYVAGLWKSRLVEMLSWVVKKPRQRCRDYLAPSWSWASVEGPVDSAMRWGEAHLVSVIDIETKSRDSDPIVSVCYGRIKLRGVLFPARWHEGSEDPSEFPWPVIASPNFHYYPDTLDDGGSDGSGPVFALPVGSTYLRATAIGFLLLKRSSTQIPDTYQRVGYYIALREDFLFNHILRGRDGERPVFGPEVRFSDINIV